MQAHSYTIFKIHQDILIWDFTQRCGLLANPSLRKCFFANCVYFQKHPLNTYINKDMKGKNSKMQFITAILNHLNQNFSLILSQ